jgi:AcrR family transcriptional regulator
LDQPTSTAEHDLVADPGSRGPRARPTGRTELQQQQKQISRQQLLKATHEAFAELTYAGTTVDDIVSRAKVNRSTFYRHFDGKFAITKALFEPFWPRLFAEYDQLSASADPTAEEISDWVARLIVFYRANRALFLTLGQISALEAEGVQWEETVRLEVIRLLGRRIPAFRRASSDDATPEARVRVRLLMFELEVCLFDLAFKEATCEPRAMVRVLIGEFQRFVREGVVASS